MTKREAVLKMLLDAAVFGVAKGEALHVEKTKPGRVRVTLAHYEIYEDYPLPDRVMSMPAKRWHQLVVEHRAHVGAVP